MVKRVLWTAAMLMVASRMSGQSIAGRVIDRATGRPLRAAVVRVLGDSGRVIGESTTDTTGVFYVDLLQPGRVVVRFMVDSASNFDSSTLAVGAGEFVQREFVIGDDPVFFEFQVQKQVRQIPGWPGPRYPSQLKQQNIEGEVLAQFVVDIEGRVDMHTLRVLKSTDPLFTQAVRDALVTLRYLPAEVGGQKVRQMVQQPYTFSLR
jgi:TonB family protein